MELYEGLRFIEILPKLNFYFFVRLYLYDNYNF